MSKIVKYDAEGNEVYFDYAVDAREAVASGFFFDEKPVKVKEEGSKEEPKSEKKEKKVKEEIIPEDLKIDIEE